MSNTKRLAVVVLLCCLMGAVACSEDDGDDGGQQVPPNNAMEEMDAFEQGDDMGMSEPDADEPDEPDADELDVVDEPDVDEPDAEELDAEAPDANEPDIADEPDVMDEPDVVDEPDADEPDVPAGPCDDVVCEPLPAQCANNALVLSQPTACEVRDGEPVCVFEGLRRAVNCGDSGEVCHEGEEEVGCLPAVVDMVPGPDTQGRALAVLSDGTVRFWSSNRWNAVPEVTDVVKVDFGRTFGAALTGDGRMILWGPDVPADILPDHAGGALNVPGELMLPGDVEAVDVGVGNGYVVVLTGDGDALAYGRSLSSGRTFVGDVLASGVAALWKGASAGVGLQFTDGGFGHIGLIGSRVPRGEGEAMAGAPTFSLFKGGASVSCGLREAGQVACIGRAEGYAETEGNVEATTDVFTDVSGVTGAVDVAAHFTAMALMDDGNLRIWGSGTCDVFPCGPSLLEWTEDVALESIDTVGRFFMFGLDEYGRVWKIRNTGASIELMAHDEIVSP